MWVGSRDLCQGDCVSTGHDQETPPDRWLCRRPCRLWHDADVQRPDALSAHRNRRGACPWPLQGSVAERGQGNGLGWVQLLGL